MWGNPTLGYLGDLRTRVFQQFCLVGWSLKSNSLAWLQDTPFGPRMPKRHQLVTDIGEVPVMEKMQDPKMCWAFLFPGHGVVVAVYPSHALISLQWYGSYPGFKRVILLHRSMIFPGSCKAKGFWFVIHIPLSVQVLAKLRLCQRPG